MLELLGAPPSQVEGDAAHKIGADPLIFLKPMIDEYLRDRLDNPHGDLMSELAHATLKDRTKPDFDVLSGLARFLFTTGHDTTSRLIAMAVKVLAEDRELQQNLREHPEKTADFIEEVLRYDAPVKAIYRLARRTTEIGVAEISVLSPAVLPPALRSLSAGTASAHPAGPAGRDRARRA